MFTNTNIFQKKRNMIEPIFRKILSKMKIRSFINIRVEKIRVSNKIEA